MREILFRGKRTGNGEWIEGYFVKAHWYIDQCELVAIMPLDLALYPHSEFSECYEIIPETVGQYTGLTDKNGKKIFEGDICQIKGVTYIDETPFVIEWNNDWCGWYWRNLDFGSATDSFTKSIAKSCKVIGNIHDNPELLKGGE